MKKVVFFKDNSKIGKALGFFNIDSLSNKKVLFKIHMGEVRNKYYPKPSVIKPFIQELERKKVIPFFYDTTVSYSGLRHSKRGYEKVARMHGYTKFGYDVIIDDTGVNVDVEGRSYEVGKTLYNSSDIFAFSHVKGHIATGMGGAIKNFGMGGVTKENKRRMHHASRPIYKKDKCTFCGVCAEVCPFDAIDIKDNSWRYSERKCFGCGVCVDNCDYNAIVNEEENFQYLLACAAKSCVYGKNVLYVNDVNRISKSCDCDPMAGPIICPDIGYLVSDDIVAIDKASLDLVNRSKPDVFLKENNVDPEKQIKFGEEIGLGSSSYQLIEI